MRFKDKVVIVTGASRAIGKTIAIAFAREGADLVLAARTVSEEDAPATRPGTIMATAEEVRALGRRALPVKTDVGVRSEVEEMVKKTVEEFGRIDILVNTAWSVGWKAEPLDDLMRVEESDATIETFRGVVNCFRAVLPHMRSQKYGRIISITSVGAKIKPVPCPVYAGLKAGVAHFSRVVSDVVARDGITVNCVAPGIMATASTFDIFTGLEDAIAATIPVGRLEEEEEAANAVLWLASDEASYITGAHLSVDGGMAHY